MQLLSPVETLSGLKWWNPLNGTDFNIKALVDVEKESTTKTVLAFSDVQIEEIVV